MTKNEALEKLRKNLKAFRPGMRDFLPDLNHLIQRLEPDGDLGAALSQSCPTCGGAEPLAVVDMDAIYDVAGDDYKVELWLGVEEFPTQDVPVRVIILRAPNANKAEV